MTPPMAGGDIGGKVIHRLSNVEYDNTTRDLLGIELHLAEGFVHEEAEGFDNIAAALSMSPRQVEDYYSAAKELSEAVFADPELRAKIVTCPLDAADMTCATSVITDFGLRAFRRPIEQSELDLFVGTYQEAITLGESPDGAMRHVVQVMLATPQFLYRMEFDPDPADETPHALNGYELASRLSYALWSSMPDEALFTQAASGALLDEATLRSEVDRMLMNSRSDMLIKNFAAQWLGGNRVTKHVASVRVYPTWTPELAASMQREMELYFADFLYNDIPYSEFLTRDVNYIDANLAELYGMAAPAADFEPISDTTDQRQGFIGLAGFLAHTSRETRSSPIIRGKWILDALMCIPLQVPANLVVEPLPEPAEGEEPTSVRELIAAHRASPACSGCHDMIDPVGLSLEHFDGIGRYRTEYETGLPIDAKATLRTGADVDGLISLSQALAQDEGFVRCAANKFNTYALGRADIDLNYLAQIVSNWTAGEPTLRNLIKESVVSDTFRFRRADTK